MRHVVAAAAAYQMQGVGSGWVWCACGRRFDVYQSDDLTTHIAKENSVGTEK